MEKAVNLYVLNPHLPAGRLNLPPLHEAARLGDVQKVGKLLEDGESLDPSTGWSPLMLIWRTQPSALGADAC